jgi:hypothetical protein
MDNLPHVELPPIENDLEGTAIFQRLRATPAAPNPLADQRELQESFDDVLSRLGTRAVAPKDGESHHDYLATLSTQAAAFGPEERKGINRLSLPDAALAEVARQDLAIAKAEIERPRYSLKPGETREVIKVDRAGHQIREFFNAEGRCSWLNDFKPDVISYVSGGTAGFAQTDQSGTYHFTKDHLPEIRAAVAQAEYQDSAEFKVRRAYADAGLAAPPDVLAKVRGR